MTTALDSRTLRLALLGVFAIISAAIVFTKNVEPPIGDSYENYAYALAEWGVFADATNSSVEPPAGAGRAPLYPMFLAAIMRLDDRDKARGKCFVDTGEKCPLRGGLTPYVQLALMAAGAVLVFEIALLFGAWPSLAFLFSTIASLPMLEIVYEYQVSEAIALPLFGLASYFLARWFSGSGGVGILAAVGVILGLLGLTRVAYVYFVPAAAAAVFFIQAANSQSSWKQRAAGAVAMLLAFAAVSAPWSIRNYQTLGTATASDSGVPGVLAMRASYNRMTLEEGVAATVFFIPNIGKTLAHALFSDHVIAKFDFSNPEGFRQQGWKRLDELSRSYPNPADLKKALVADVLQSPVSHVLTTIPLAVDGLKKVFWMLPFAVFAIVRAVKGRAWWLLGAVTLTLFNFAFHAAFTHFRDRYGLPMLYGVAPLAALGLTHLMAHNWRGATAANS